MTQAEALSILKLGVNVFLTPVVQTFGLTTGQAGEPGAGKQNMRELQ